MIRTIACTLVFIGVATVAENAPAAATIEEIVVTATKRPQSLQDVALAVSVMDGTMLDDQGIDSLEELTYYVPSVQISEAAVSTNIFIRGVGSGVNYGFEQSVATFIDGVYFSRSRSARNPFLDVARVEVLKGPQGVLFGKNSIAGALNITSRQPTETWENSLTAYWEPDFNTRMITGVTSGPLTDTLGMRLVGRYSDTDGYLDNSLVNEDEPERDEWALRGTLQWAPTAQLTMTLKAEASEFDVTGRADQLTVSTPAMLSLVQSIDPAAEGAFDYNKSGPGVDPFFTEEFDNTETRNVMLNIDYGLGEHTLTSITSYIAYEYDKNDDVDFSNLSLLAYPGEQDYDAWSQELRITSPLSDRFEYIVGVYYSSEDLTSNKRVDINLAAVPALDAVLPGAIPRTGARNQFFQQDTKNWAVFGQGTLHLSSVLRVTAGLRYTEDEKKANKRLYFSQIGSAVLDPLTNATYPALALGNPHEFDDLELDEDKLTPSVTVEWDVTGNVMTYATYGQGFKAGGFDEDNINGDPASEEFDPETVDSYAVGLKASLASGAAYLNVELFRSDFDDLQVSTFDGTAAFLVGNAAKARSQGVDVDFRWQATESLALGGALSLLDAEYESYAEGPCVFGAGAVCDLTGENLQFAPEYSGNVYGEYFWSVFQNWELGLQASVNFSDAYDIPGDLDPVVAQDSFYKLNARVSLNSADGRYGFALIGKNLTDEKTTSWGNDVPLGAFIGNNYFQFIDPPRTIGLQASVNF